MSKSEITKKKKSKHNLSLLGEGFGCKNPKEYCKCKDCKDDDFIVLPKPLKEKKNKILSKIISIRSKKILCDCLIDVKNRIFETRSFPKDLFRENIKLNDYIQINAKKTKNPNSNSLCFEVCYKIEFDLESQKQVFDLNDGWKDLKNSNLTKQIEL